MMSCKDASRLLSDRQDRDLTLREHWALRLHLWACGECRRFGRQLDALRRMLRGDEHGDHCCSEQELPPEARKRISQTLTQHQRHDHEG